MREIKFRLWWMHPESDSSGFDYFGVLDGFDKGDMCQEIVAIEEFTGLHDKNGREIYEGDIVKAWNDYGPGGEGQNIYAISISPYGTNLEAWTFKEDGYLPEVIGNIHENPELISANDKDGE